jgi:hypothetical protein
VARVVVSEFRLQGLDRAARFAGEVFGSEEATGREAGVDLSITGAATFWTASAVVALCGFFVLVM